MTNNKKGSVQARPVLLGEIAVPLLHGEIVSCGEINAATSRLNIRAWSGIANVPFGSNVAAVSFRLASHIAVTTILEIAIQLNQKEERHMTNSILERKAQIERDAKLFRSLDAKTATQLMKENPAEYARLKACDRQGDPGPQSGVRRGLAIKHYTEVPAAPHSDADITLMIQYPKEVCEKFYKPDLQANDQNFILAKQTEQARENIRNAAILHNVIAGELRYRSVEPPAVKTEDDQRVNAGELGKLAGLPPDARITVRQYNDLLAADARRLAARTPQQVAQDHATALRISADKAQAAADAAKGN
jgi:hypothetical protein